MTEQMEKINIEDIMQEIRAQIKERGYTEKDLNFADVVASDMRGNMIVDYFEIDNFSNTVEQMENSYSVHYWRVFGGNKIAAFIKKVIRKMIKFYVEPIVKEQNQFNLYTTSALSQIRAKYEEEQDIKLTEMQKKIEQLEKRCAELEQKCGE